MIQLVLVKLRHNHSTKKTYAVLSDGYYNMIVIDGKKFNECRYSLDGRFNVLVEDYIDDQFVMSRAMRKVVYDDENKDILKSSNVMQRVDVPNEIFDTMIIDGSIALEMIDKDDIMDGAHWKFQQKIIIKAIPNKYHLLAEYMDESGNICSSKIHYHYGEKITITDNGRNICINLDGACIKNMTVDGDIKEEVDVSTSTILSSKNFN